MKATKLLKISVIVLGLSFLLLTIYVMQPYYSFYKSQKTGNIQNSSPVVSPTGFELSDVQIAADVPETDDFELNSATIDTSNQLLLEVSYGGGCETHELELYWSGEITGNQLSLDIVHDANGDICEAYLTENWSFDLAPLFDLYQDNISKIIFNYGDQTYNLKVSDATQ